MLKTVDRLGGAVFIAAAGMLPRNGKITKESKKVLVIRFSGIGETLLTLPMVKILKENGYTVDGFALRRRAKVVFNNCGLFDHVYGLNDLHKLHQKYDIAIDAEAFTNFSALVSMYCAKATIGFSGQGRSKLYDHKVRYNDQQHVVYTFCDLLSPLGIKHDKPNALEPLRFKRETHDWAEKFLAPYGKKYSKLIGIYPSSEKTVPERRWKRFPELIEALLEKRKDACIFLTGSGAEDREVNSEIMSKVKSSRVIDTCDKLSFGEFCSVIGELDLFISNDSGPMHIAAAMGIPTIGLFGPNLPLRFAPFGKGNIGVYKCGPEVKPSINVHLGEFRSNPKAAECMEKISTDDVLNAIRKILGNFE